MNHPMRRSDRTLSTQDAENLLHQAIYGTLSTTCEDNSPYGCPVTYVYADKTIYIHGTSEGGLHINNTHNNPRVCFSVVPQAQVLASQFSVEYQSAIAFGSARTVINEEEKRRALMLFFKKYSPEHMEKASRYLKGMFDKTLVLAIDVESITGKAHL